jgi:heptosyltransferase III
MALARLYPQSRIIYVTHAQKGKLAEAALGVESSDIESGWHHLHGRADSLPESARRLLTGAHSVYSFVADPEDVWNTQVRQLAPSADVCLLRSTLPTDFDQHWTEYLLLQLGERPGIAMAVRQMLRSISERGIGRRAMPGTTIIMHPGSGSPGKCWPAEKYLELLHQLNANGREVCVLLGEVELERWPVDQIKTFEAAARVLAPASYLELFTLLSKASRFVGNDSGPTHLSGILGVPTYSIFGPSDPVAWRGLGPKVHVLRKIPISQISVQEVYQWIEQ